MDRIFRSSPQFVFGISIIILGLLFTLNNLEIIEARYYLRFWPAIFILVGGVKLLQPGTGGRVFGAALVTLGSLMILDRMDVIYFSVWDLWPIFIILFGFSLIRGAVRRQQLMDGRIVQSEDSDSYIKAFAVMGGIVRANDSRDFRGGEITAIMGGCELDLRRASIASGEAQIEIFAFWGGVEIKVPEDWSVIVHTVPIMGGIEDKTVSPKDGPKKKLIITGYAIMGGAEIKN